MRAVAWLLPLLPLLAAAVGLVVGRRRGPGVVAVLGAVATLVIACLVLAAQLHSEGAVTRSTAWVPTGGVGFRVGSSVDGLIAVVAVMVAAVALLVQVYSTAYMAGDPGYRRYAAEVSLFTAAMLLVVVSSSLVELLVGWEVMGLCSYLLVGHYSQVEGSRDAAVKAFLTTRVGDAGFLVGIFVLGLGAHSFDIATVVARAGTMPHVTVVAGALLLLLGVVGKSAQFPLHAWLPDAMAGPTPISALIHAATMVAAGIFLVARLYPVYLAAPAALTVLGILACITMLGAALCALAQDDLKRVLAWSTCSQLAYMAAGLAVRGWTAGVYDLLAHAAYKSLLFLAAGSVLRAVGTNLMSEMGGLWRRMPVTFVAMVVGGLSLAGIPPFAGGFAKDAVLDAARSYGGPLGDAVYVTGLVTAVVTAAYVTRLVFRVFLGERRDTADASESPLSMTGPLIVLALAVLGLGVPALSHTGGVARWLSSGYAGLSIGVGGSVLATALAVVGVLAVVGLWRRWPARDPISVLDARIAALLAAGFALDSVYDRGVVRPLRALSRAVVRTDDRGIDAAVVGSGKAATMAGGGLRLVQNGNAQRYVTGVVLTLVVVVLAVSVAVAP